VLTRTRAIPSLTSVVVAPITTTVHRIASQLPVGVEEGLSRPSAANCDNLQSVEKTLIDERRVGRIAPSKARELDAALCFALQIR
jgi:mRNA interferase MazF